MNAPKRLILASTSPARRALLDATGLKYEAQSPGVDEHVDTGMSVDEIVAHLAQRKARAVFSRHPEAWVIGSDQLAEVDGEPLGKPEDRASARAQLQRLCGGTHRLHTGLCLIGPGFEDVRVETVSLTFHALTAEELERYLDLDEWVGCAGGYRIEAAGQCLVRKLEGDRATVMGLPVLQLVSMLRAHGFELFPRT